MKEELLNILLEFKQDALDYPMRVGSKPMEERFTLESFIEWLRLKILNERE